MSLQTSFVHKTQETISQNPPKQYLILYESAELAVIYAYQTTNQRQANKPGFGSILARLAKMHKLV